MFHKAANIFTSSGEEGGGKKECCSFGQLFLWMSEHWPGICMGHQLLWQQPSVHIGWLVACIPQQTVASSWPESVHWDKDTEKEGFGFSLIHLDLVQWLRNLNWPIYGNQISFHQTNLPCYLPCVIFHSAFQPSQTPDNVAAKFRELRSFQKCCEHNYAKVNPVKLSLYCMTFSEGCHLCLNAVPSLPNVFILYCYQFSVFPDRLLLEKECVVEFRCHMWR